MQIAIPSRENVSRNLNLSISVGSNVSNASSDGEETPRRVSTAQSFADARISRRLDFSSEDEDEHIVARYASSSDASDTEEAVIAFRENSVDGSSVDQSSERDISQGSRVPKPMDNDVAEDESRDSQEGSSYIVEPDEDGSETATSTGSSLQSAPIPRGELRSEAAEYAAANAPVTSNGPPSLSLKDARKLLKEIAATKESWDSPIAKRVLHYAESSGEENGSPASPPLQSSVEHRLESSTMKTDPQKVQRNLAEMKSHMRRLLRDSEFFGVKARSRGEVVDGADRMQKKKVLRAGPDGGSEDGLMRLSTSKVSNVDGVPVAYLDLSSLRTPNNAKSPPENGRTRHSRTTAKHAQPKASPYDDSWKFSSPSVGSRKGVGASPSGRPGLSIAELSTDSPRLMTKFAGHTPRYAARKSTDKGRQRKLLEKGEQRSSATVEKASRDSARVTARPRKGMSEQAYLAHVQPAPGPGSYNTNRTVGTATTSYAALYSKNKTRCAKSPARREIVRTKSGDMHSRAVKVGRFSVQKNEVSRSQQSLFVEVPPVGSYLHCGSAFSPGPVYSIPSGFQKPKRPQNTGFSTSSRGLTVDSSAPIVSGRTGLQPSSSSSQVPTPGPGDYRSLDIGAMGSDAVITKLKESGLRQRRASVCFGDIEGSMPKRSLSSSALSYRSLSRSGSGSSLFHQRSIVSSNGEAHDRLVEGDRFSIRRHEISRDGTSIEKSLPRQDSYLRSGASFTPGPGEYEAKAGIFKGTKPRGRSKSVTTIGRSQRSLPVDSSLRFVSARGIGPSLPNNYW